MFEQYVLPDFESCSRPDITPVADFVVRRLLSLSSSLKTAVDARERDELFCEMLKCNAALMMLNLAFLTEHAGTLVSAKDLLKSFQ